MATAIKSDPEISVVITTYNREPKTWNPFTKDSQFLRKAIASVLSQSFQDFELIIVDDFSTDGTEEYCRKMLDADDRITYIRLEQNAGSHSKPKNVGSMAAKGKYIAYLDDDNTWEKDHLMALKKALDENQKFGFAYCDRYIIAKGMPVGTPESMDWHPIMLQDMNYIDTSDIMIRKEVLAKVGGWDESLKKFADWNLLVRLAKNGEAGFHVPLRLSNYVMHEGSAQLRHPSLVDEHNRPLPTFDPANCTVWPVKTSYGEKPVQKVCIITVTWNREDYLKRTVASMNAKAGYAFDHLIVNNGKVLSDHFQQMWRDPESNVVGIIDMKGNVGVPAAYNTALKTMEMLENADGEKYDIVILTDNDADFKSDNWLADIVDLFSRNKKLIVSPYIEGLRDNPGGSKRTGIRMPDGREIVPRNGYIGPHYMGFVMHMGNIVQAMPRVFWDNFRLDENTFKHGTQSFQIAQAALRKGFVLAYMENVKVEHMDTTSGQEKANPEYAELTAKMKTEKYE